jgi:hypothetical protein
MPNWKKVILSGSNAHINNITASGHVSALDDSFTINEHTSTELFVDGNITSSNLLILNTASITYFETTYESSSIIYSSGSTKFGDTMDDFHDFTGSVYITGSTNVVGNITASNNISASGNLFALVSDDSDTNFKTVMYDTSTGKFFRTGSYGGGSGGVTPGGVAKSIQYNDGSSGFDGESAFQYDESSNTLSLSNSDESKTQGLSSPDNAANLYTGKQAYYLAEKATPTGIFGLFDKLNKYLCLQPPTQNGAQTTTTSVHAPSSRLHVLDDPTDNSGVITKIINQNNKGKYNLLLGTATGPGTMQGAHKFISFHVESGNDGGTELNGGLLYDPNSNVFGIQQSFNTVIFQGITVQSSDKKLKKHITFTKKSIDDIMSIKVKDFRWKEQPKDTPKNTGFIAQDLLETHPEMIRNIDGTLNVEYDKIIPLLVKAVQDQQHQIDDLKEQLKNKQL